MAPDLISTATAASLLTIASRFIEVLMRRAPKGTLEHRVQQLERWKIESDSTERNQDLLYRVEQLEVLTRRLEREAGR